MRVPGYGLYGKAHGRYFVYALGLREHGLRLGLCVYDFGGTGGVDGWRLTVDEIVNHFLDRVCGLQLIREKRDSLIDTVFDGLFLCDGF